MDEHDLTKHIWIQKLKTQKHNMNQIKSAIKTQKLKRKQQLKGVWNPITICTRNCSRSIEQKCFGWIFQIAHQNKLKCKKQQENYGK